MSVAINGTDGVETEYAYFTLTCIATGGYPEPSVVLENENGVGGVGTGDISYSYALWPNAAGEVFTCVASNEAGSLETRVVVHTVIPA